jgi:hypothetical protein
MGARCDTLPDTMIIVAGGRGVLIGIITFALLIATEYLTERHFHDANYYQEQGWPKLAAFAASAFLIWILGPRSPGDERAYLPTATTDGGSTG